MALDLDMIVVRFTKSGKLCQSRPCFHCLKALSESGINVKNVYYSKDDDIMKEKFADMMTSDLTVVSSGMRFKERQNKNKQKNSDDDFYE